MPFAHPTNQPRKMNSYHEEDGDFIEHSRLIPSQGEEPLIDGQILPSYRFHFCPLSWVLTAIFATILVLQNVYYMLQESSCRFGPVYDTDLEPMKPYTSTVKVRFTSPLYVENGTIHRRKDNSDAPQYVDAPANVLDANWDSLINGRYFRLTEKEVNSLNEDPDLPLLLPMHQNGEDLYFAGIGMLHSLHCLNALRKHLDPDFQEHVAPGGPDGRRMHIDHCLEQLRQAIMCHGDTTPVTLRPVLQDSAFPSLLGETERLHTCRDAARLREQMTVRGRITGTIDMVVV